MRHAFVLQLGCALNSFGDKGPDFAPVLSTLYFDKYELGIFLVLDVISQVSALAFSRSQSW